MSAIHRRIALHAGALFVSCLFAATAPGAPAEDAIEATMRRAMDEFRVPGVTLSIVYNGQVHYSGGQGVLEVGTDREVDEHTLFQIASVSKAFTAATLAILVDEGKLGWDDPVIDYLPEFRMYDPWVTREFMVRDLLTHRSGLPPGAGDLLLFPDAESTREEIIRAMRYLKPTSSFRSSFDYDNLLYIIAGEVVASVAGTTFEDFLEQRLLFPLGMTDCAATLARTDARAAKATPHVIVEGNLQTTSSLETPVAAAAGGINCSARSMTAWMAFVLNKGRNADGEQIVSEEQVDELLKPVTLLPPSDFSSEHAGTFLRAYALGWNVSTFYGQPLYSHGGGLWGMTTYLAILPEQDLAVFVSNNQLSPAPRAIVNAVLDQFLRPSGGEGGEGGEDGKDWIAIIAGVSGERRRSADEAVSAANAARDADSRPLLPLEAYAGVYRDPWYGEIRISLDDGRLFFRSGRSDRLSGPLEHFQFNTFIARWTDRSLNADAYVSFVLTPEGEIERIRMKAVSPATDFSFDFHDLDLKRVSPL